ncbi:MAG: hypothetical protein F6K53_41345 [Moorea sp. SIO4A1]|uniref:hypothetical protein n=1 Tax=Moorena sp. SIO4A1 TaxID=2607835 RepID=UPI00144FF62B|nr:hypothetical protein [Moorena sp. SIO4A1]NEQ63426.1 hypothetical protein [Moorena sp. SIO4A1]
MSCNFFFLLPVPCSLFTVPYSLFPIPFAIFYTNIKNTPSISLHRNSRRHDQENVIEEKG